MSEINDLAREILDRLKANTYPCNIYPLAKQLAQMVLDIEKAQAFYKKYYLTPPEQRVLAQLLISTDVNKIADKLCYEPYSIYTYANRIRKKLEVKTTQEAIDVFKSYMQ